MLEILCYMLFFVRGKLWNRQREYLFLLVTYIAVFAILHNACRIWGIVSCTCSIVCFMLSIVCFIACWICYVVDPMLQFVCCLLCSACCVFYTLCMFNIVLCMFYVDYYTLYSTCCEFYLVLLCVCNPLCFRHNSVLSSIL